MGHMPMPITGLGDTIICWLYLVHTLNPGAGTRLRVLRVEELKKGKDLTPSPQKGCWMIHVY